MSLNESSTAVLSRLEPIAFALLRVVAGGALYFHGAQKLLGWFANHPSPPTFSQLWVGGVIELVGGVLIALGLLTRSAAFLVSGTLAVAYIQFHWKLRLDGFRFLPIVNQGELALIYSFLFLFIFAHGAGRFSLDGLRSKKGS